MDRIGCLHVRNIKHLGSDRRFRESSHLSSDGDLDMYEIMKAAYETCPDTYIRPDHGRMIWDEVGRPGYGLYDRALASPTLTVCGKPSTRTRKGDKLMKLTLEGIKVAPPGERRHQTAGL